MMITGGNAHLDEWWYHLYIGVLVFYLVKYWRKRMNESHYEIVFQQSKYLEYMLRKPSISSSFFTYKYIGDYLVVCVFFFKIKDSRVSFLIKVEMIRINWKINLIARKFFERVVNVYSEMRIATMQDGKRKWHDEIMDIKCFHFD